MKLPVAVLKLLALTASCSLQAGDFDHWYFKFFEGSTEITEELDLSAKDRRLAKKLRKALDALDGRRETPDVLDEEPRPEPHIGALSAGGDAFVISETRGLNAYKYSRLEEEAKQGNIDNPGTTRWKKAPGGGFAGTYTDSVYQDWTVSLVLLSGNRFRIEGEEVDGPRVFTTEGRLDADGKIYSKTKFRNGNFPVTFKTVIRKKESVPEEQSLIAERTWTNVDGRELTAALVSVKGETGRFRRPDGSLFEYPISKLSDADQDLITEETFGVP